MSGMATKPTLAAVNEDVENIPLDETADTYKQKSRNVEASKSRKKRRLAIGLILALGILCVVFGVAAGLTRNAAEAKAEAEAAYNANYDEGMAFGEDFGDQKWYDYSEECKKWRARSLEGDEKTPTVHMKRKVEVADAAPEKASGVERRLHIEFGKKVGYLADRISMHRLDPQVYFLLRRLSTSVRIKRRLLKSRGVPRRPRCPRCARCVKQADIAGGDDYND